MTLFREYSPEDLPRVLDMELRKADIDELRACTGMHPVLALRESLRVSKVAWVIEHDGEIEGVFGVAVSPYNYRPDIGVPWLLMTDRVKEFPKQFLKGSRDVVNIMLGHFSTLSNIVDSRHTEAVRWLRWLGFEFISTDITRVDPDVKFWQFVKYRGEN